MKRSKAAEAAGVELCIVCGFDFASHEWFTPAGMRGKGLHGRTLSEGHDFTPIQGPSKRHSRWSPEAQRESG